MRSHQNLFPKYLLPCLVLAGSCPGAMRAQESADLRRILERLERLEQANRELVTEVRELRRELHTANNPGHTADSVCFSLPGDRFLDSGETRGTVLTGDTILGRGTTIIADPDGALGPYLDSLGRLAALGAPGPVGVLPGHGPVLPDLAAICRAYLAHRAERLDQVRAALRELGADASTAAVTDLVYADTYASVRSAAEASVRAQLAYLRRASISSE